MFSHLCAMGSKIRKASPIFGSSELQSLVAGGSLVIEGEGRSEMESGESTEFLCSV